MKWLEIIEIRSACGCQKKIMSQLINLIEEVARHEKQLNLKVYKLATLDTGYCIHLLYDSDRVESEGSRLGLHLASTMKEFGLVSHSVRVEIHGILQSEPDND